MRFPEILPPEQHQILQKLAEQLAQHKRIPVATYRVQFSPDFTFQDARKIVSYLNELGITDLYCSPYLKARPGSTHGYDICDHQALNPELGSESDYDAFASELKKFRMGQIMDVVPNHMSIWETSNELWMDVLENGPSSPYASFFDIDWHPLRGDTDLENRVLLPILGNSYGEVLENQQLSLIYSAGAFFIHYYEHNLPLDPHSYGDILQLVVAMMNQQMEPGHPHIQEMESILTAIGHLPARSALSQTESMERQREKEVIKRRLKTICEDSPMVQMAVDEAVRSFNGNQGDPESFNRLDSLLDRQVYRLANWRVAAEEINYRRFFDINDLAAIRTEDPQVFDHTHELVFWLLRQEKATGLRIDHPDGLWDPANYFNRLQAIYLMRAGRYLLSQPQQLTDEPLKVPDISAAELSHSIGAERLFRPKVTPLYVVAEKILSGDETLPRNWAVDGTTGYDFANIVNGIFVDELNRRAFDAIYRDFTGQGDRYRDLVNDAKKMVMATSLASEINMLAYQLKRIAGRSRKHRDFTLNGIAIALREAIAALPVYRTYITASSLDPRDQQYLDNAIAEAKKRNRRAGPILEFLHELLLLKGAGDREIKAQAIEFICKFQQVTGPVMAKALEDTVFYRYNRLISLNEVGGDPGLFGIPISRFHNNNLDRLERWPHSLNSTSTHDTKRSEDVRARINVLSEMPQEWQAALYRWNRLNRHHKSLWEGRAVPDKNEEYYLYQTLLGAWPVGSISDGEYEQLKARMEAHLLKALREAKITTGWNYPDSGYEERAVAFLRAIMDREKENAFLEDFQLFQKKISHFGIWNSLSQTLLKIASPGVPDFYQGTELWDFSLADPDNRRPVDYTQLREVLRGLRRRISYPRIQKVKIAKELVESREDGRIKMFMIHIALSYRQRHRLLFQDGSYIPLECAGRHNQHVCAFARQKEEKTVVIAVPRLIAGLTRGERIPPLGSEVWGYSQIILPPNLAGGQYQNLFTEELIQTTPMENGQGLALASLFASYPVAFLERVD